MRVGIAGGSGYAGAELLRLCDGHPDLEVVWAAAASLAGTGVADLYPSLAPAYGGMVFREMSPADAEGLDLVFLALPHGASQRLVPEMTKAVETGTGAGAIVDLAGDFRLGDPGLYPQWYGAAHEAPELLARAVTGLPELTREQLPGASLVSVPGCYPTAAALALAPLVKAGGIERQGVVVDAASGASGAGRQPSNETLFATVDEDFRAYGLLGHRHTPEMEALTGAQVLFTPHLAPMSRGILATCYARPAPSAGKPDPLGLLAEAYAHEPFVVVSERPPSTKATLGSNCAHLTARYDERTGWIVVICALDNLVKGASGQAVQCANLVLGLPETAGLPRVGLCP